MILEKLTLHNFCLYRGKQSFDLAPSSRNQPVVLIGGLNGGGKTTILDAVQLALYGGRARVSKREGIPYETFLRSCINRGVDAKDGASISLQFRYVSGGEQKLYEVRRSWSEKRSNVRESVTVQCDGNHDRHLSDHWNDIVEELIPLGISRLFFFDAEQVRFLADDESAHIALGSAVKSLLGLDLAERLIADASVLENRLSARLAAVSDDPAYKRLLKELEEVDTAFQSKNRELASLESARLRAVKTQREADAAFQQLGGPHWLDREARKRELAQVQETERELRQDLVRAAATDLPLTLAPRLLERVEQQDQSEQLARESLVVESTLSVRDKEILKALRKEGIEKKTIDVVKRLQDRDRKARVQAIATPVCHGLSERARASLHQLRNGVAEGKAHHLTELLGRLEKMKSTREQLERSLEMTPEESTVKDVFERLKAATEDSTRRNAEAKRLADELDVLRSQRAEAEKKVKAIQRKNTDSEIDTEEAGRMIKMAVRTQDTMREYLNRATKEKISHLSKQIGEAFQFLLRKQSLVERVEIDPETFHIALFDMSGAPLPKERLSEGEKQIFAISVLWGLAKASPRPLPAIIDTPMARLDSEHRSHLVSRYFPHASHQVIVLSTDSEVDRDSYAELLPHISHSFHLRYDEADQCTMVEEGYFPSFDEVHGSASR